MRHLSKHGIWEAHDSILYLIRVNENSLPAVVTFDIFIGAINSQAKNAVTSIGKKIINHIFQVEITSVNATQKHIGLIAESGLKTAPIGELTNAYSIINYSPSV